MAKEGLKTWFKQQWVDIGSKRKDGRIYAVNDKNTESSDSFS